MSITFHVYFEDPFWVGLFTRADDGHVSYCRIVFGGEPSDAELYQFICLKFHVLKFSASRPCEVEEVYPDNPKRRKRQIARMMREGSGTRKSHEAIKAAIRQEAKTTGKSERKKSKEKAEALIYEVKKLKRKEKHRGH